MVHLSDYGRKLVAGVFFLVVAVAVVAVQVFNFGDRPASQNTATSGYTQTAPSQPRDPSPSPSGVQMSQLVPVPVPDLARLADDAVEFAAILEDPTLAPPDKYNRLEGRATSLAVNDSAALPPSSASPPRIRLDKAVLVSPDYVTFTVINEEHPGKPRYISFSELGGDGWIVTGYTDTPGIGHD